jgi:hypothetical protein
MGALVIPLEQPAVTGLVFFIWDMILLAIFIAGTTKLASYLTRRDMEKGASVSPKEFEFPHVSGGVAATKPSVQATILCSRAVSSCDYLSRWTPVIS